MQIVRPFGYVITMFTRHSSLCCRDDCEFNNQLSFHVFLILIVIFYGHSFACNLLLVIFAVCLLYWFYVCIL